MTTAEKVEVAGGVITASLGAVAVPLAMLADAAGAPRGVSEGPAGWAGVAILLLLLFIAPSLLVAYGSYLHAAYGEARGRGLVAVGSLFLAASFGACVLTAGYGAAYLIRARLLLVIVSLVTWVAAGSGGPGAARRGEGGG